MSQLMTREITDAAYELRAFALHLKSFGEMRGHAYTIIAERVHAHDYTTYPVVRAYAAVNKRCDDLREFISRIQQSELEEENRITIVEAVLAVQQVFSPDNFFTDWRELLIRQLTKEHLVALQFASPTIRRLRSIPKIDKSEFEKLKHALEEASREISQISTLPDWAKEPLFDGINGLLFILTNFEFFGYDAALSQLVNLHAVGGAVLKTLEEKGGVRQSLVELATALALTVSVFAAPYEAWQASYAYGNWINALSNSMTPLIEHPPLQLPSPKNQSSNIINT